MRQELRDLKEHIYEDGAISDSEVALLASYFKAKFDAEEAGLLLSLNNILSGHDISPAFADLYVSFLSDFVAGSGNMSHEHWVWLHQELHDDSQIDAIEQRLLKEIASRLAEPPESLIAMLSAEA